MSADKEPSYIDKKLAQFTALFEAALEKERGERIAARKEYDAQRVKDREEHRRVVAVETGKLYDMWGKLAEFVIESGIVTTLNRHHDLHVDDALPNVGVRCQDEDGKPEDGQIDIIVSGERDIVIVETKTTLTVGDVKYFLGKYLRSYTRWQASSPHINLPSCAGMRLFGCLAYMKAEPRAEEVAVREGLLTVHAFGDSSDLAHPDTALIDYHPDRYRPHP